MESKPYRFCKTIERLAGLAAVREEWLQELREEWKWAAALLRQTDRVATTYPRYCESTGDHESTWHAPYEIVWRDGVKDIYVGSCPDEGGTIELCRDQLLIYDLDREALSHRLVDALGITYDFDAHPEGLTHAWRLGASDPMSDDETWFYLDRPCDRQAFSDTVSQLLARHDRTCVLLTPTKFSWRPMSNDFRSRLHLIAMDEGFAVSSDGRWRSTTSPVWPARPSASHGVPLPYQPTPNELAVIRVLRKSGCRLSQEQIAAATPEVGRRLARRTVGDTLTPLADRGLVDYPPKHRKGAAITAAGQALVDAIDGRRH